MEAGQRERGMKDNYFIAQYKLLNSIVFRILWSSFVEAVSNWTSFLGSSCCKNLGCVYSYQSEIFCFFVFVLFLRCGYAEVVPVRRSKPCFKKLSKFVVVTCISDLKNVWALEKTGCYRCGPLPNSSRSGLVLWQFIFVRQVKQLKEAERKRHCALMKLERKHELQGAVLKRKVARVRLGRMNPWNFVLRFVLRLFCIAHVENVPRGLPTYFWDWLQALWQAV